MSQDNTVETVGQDTSPMRIMNFLASAWGCLGCSNKPTNKQLRDGAGYQERTREIRLQAMNQA